MSHASVLLYGPQGTGKNLVAPYLAKLLKLDKIVDGWPLRGTYPATGAVVIAEVDADHSNFTGRRISIDEAMKLTGFKDLDTLRRADKISPRDLAKIKRVVSGQKDRFRRPFAKARPQRNSGSRA